MGRRLVRLRLRLILSRGRVQGDPRRVVSDAGLDPGADGADLVVGLGRGAALGIEAQDLVDEALAGEADAPEVAGSGDEEVVAAGVADEPAGIGRRQARDLGEGPLPG